MQNYQKSNDLDLSVVTYDGFSEDTIYVCQGFYNIAKFSQVIGTIDCTHVKIQSPDTLNELLISDLSIKKNTYMYFYTFFRWRRG